MKRKTAACWKKVQQEQDAINAASVSAEKGGNKMDVHTLARWNKTCSEVTGGPFQWVTVFVDKVTSSAVVLFMPNKPGVVSGAKILSGIGGDTATFQEIGNEIVTVGRQHGLLDDETQVSIFEGRLAS
jgi:hypothetical protein